MLASLLRTLFKNRVPAVSGLRRLHLGCGRDIRSGWINLDVILNRIPYAERKT